MMSGISSISLFVYSIAFSSNRKTMEHISASSRLMLSTVRYVSLSSASANSVFMPKLKTR